MRSFYSARRSEWSWASLLGIVCIALVLMTGVVQVTHYHTSDVTGQIDHDCSLCVTAHNVVQVVTLVTLDLSSQRVAEIVPEETLPLPRQRFLHKLYIRPPPAAPAFA